MSETITLGNLLTIASVIVGVVGIFLKLSHYHADNQSRLAIIETRLEAIWHWFVDRRNPSDYGG